MTDIATHSNSRRCALLIGTSSGIGLALAQQLLRQGYTVCCVSRSPTPLDDPRAIIEVLDVRVANYAARLRALDETYAFELCVYAAGIGHRLDPNSFAGEVDSFAVNLTGLVDTAATILPRMVQRGSGHLVGLSSLAAVSLNPRVPSYSGSKAGMAFYLQSLGLALRAHGVHVTDLQFGFVDTKMAQASHKPMIMTTAQAAEHVMYCVRRRPIRYVAPRRMRLVMGLVNFVQRFRVLLFSLRLPFSRRLNPPEACTAGSLNRPAEG